ncbi:uncharacterized protein LOC143074544 [Mytilus galloprovincialis]|uniref:uncharacterized protein LOC143074544 n=1 Tax=Mytilus galloprovincialis TaxID=29158 RepID=UPI003F7C8341
MKNVTVMLLIMVKGVVTGLMFYCPTQSEWRHRADAMCSSEDKYVCLFNLLEKKNNEDCSGSELSNIGSKLVFQPLFNHAKCNTRSYQPFIFTTIGNSDCTFLKSTCNEEGQVIFSNGSSINDVACRCDYTKRYVFVKNPRSPCFCKPSEEDCSCIRVNCKNLSSDYQCILDGDAITKKTCPEIHPLISYNRNDTTVGSIKSYLNEFPANYHRQIISIVIIGFLLVVLVICIFVLPRIDPTDNEDKYTLETKFWVGAFELLVSKTSVKHSNDWKILENTGELTDSLMTQLIEKDPDCKKNLIKKMKKSNLILQMRGSSTLYIPYLMRQYALANVRQQFMNNTPQFKRTSWLCLDFDVLHPGLFNYVIAWYMKRYYVSVTPTSERNAIYHQIVVFDLEKSQSKRLVVCKGQSIIALQVWDWQNTESAYGNLRRNLFKFFDTFKEQISYTATFKCDHDDFVNHRKEINELTDKHYHCVAHNTMHLCDQLVQPWGFAEELEKERAKQKKETAKQIISEYLDTDLQRLHSH